jgi:PleD family two-component response regulator
MTRDDDPPTSTTVRTQNAVLRTLAHELRRQRSEPETTDDLEGQVVEESARLASAMREANRARQSRSPGAPELDSAVGDPISGRRCRILIVDDDEGARTALAAWLGRDYEVVTAGDGIEGLERAAEMAPDIVIADVWMPRLDGVSMVNRMKRIDSLRDVPVVFLSGQTEPVSIAAGFSAGGHSYLTKPIDLGLLEDELRLALGSQSPRPEGSP